MSDRDDTQVEVCDRCKMACCWQGEFMCDEAKEARSIFMTVGELRKLNLEHPHYWES